MRDPLEQFDWTALYDRYDGLCKRFKPTAPQLKSVTPKPQSDRELHYFLIDRIHAAHGQRLRLSVDVYRALLYWKLYSYPQALGNTSRWLCPNVRAARPASLVYLLRDLPHQLNRDAGDVIDLLRRLDNYEVIGMRSRTSLPMRTTFLHYLFPQVVPVFDRMVLQAVGVQEKSANTRITVFREYLGFAWMLADRYATRFPIGYRESQVRLIDMALWVVRGKG